MNDKIPATIISKDEADKMLGKKRRMASNLLPEPQHKLFQFMGKIGEKKAREVYEVDFKTGNKKLIYKIK